MAHKNECFGFIYINVVYLQLQAKHIGGSKYLSIGRVPLMNDLCQCLCFCVSVYFTSGIWKIDLCNSLYYTTKEKSLDLKSYD